MDEDYNNLSVLRGTPPKVIWIVLGNCKTSEIEALLRARTAEIEALGRDTNAGTLVLG
jgi:predicted nuclease of predicted toxin-antitoxin system